MKMRLTVVHEYDTGDDIATQSNYGTTDPATCVAVDNENIEMMGIVGFLVHCDVPITSHKLEVVPSD